MTPDTVLLNRYAIERDEAAFAELVGRHLAHVYSAALRLVGGDTHLAEDVAQTVFIDLARRARSLRRCGALSGWLHTSARFAAAKLVRAEQRRRRREQTALAMPATSTAPDSQWEQLCPILDQAIGELSNADRDAVLLRYCEKKPFADIGAALGLSENTARMRVDRALDKLRGALVKRGIACSALTLATILTEKAVHAVPVGVARLVQASALEAAKTVCAPSLVTTMLSALAKMNLSTLLLSSLGLLLSALLALHLHSTLMRTSREPPKSEIAANSPPEAAGSGIRRTWSVNSRPPATPEDPVIAAALDKLRQLLYGPTIESVYPSLDLTAVLDQLSAETNRVLQVLVEALQDNDLQKKLHYAPRSRAVSSLGYLRTKAEAALPALMELVHTKHAPGQDMAIRSALPAIRPVPELAQELMDVFKTDAVVVSIASGYPAGYQGEKITVHEPGMSQAIAEGIARLMNEHPDTATEVGGFLVSLLSDSDGDVRVLAASALLHPSVRDVIAKQYQAAALQQLISSLKDRDPYHAQALRWRYDAALLALVNCRHSAASAAPALTEFIATHPGLDLQRMAEAALASVSSTSPK